MEDKANFTKMNGNCDSHHSDVEMHSPDASPARAENHEGKKVHNKHGSSDISKQKKGETSS